MTEQMLIPDIIKLIMRFYNIITNLFLFIHSDFPHRHPELAAKQDKAINRHAELVSASQDSTLINIKPMTMPHCPIGCKSKRIYAEDQNLFVSFMNGFVVLGFWVKINPDSRHIFIIDGGNSSLSVTPKPCVTLNSFQGLARVATYLKEYLTKTPRQVRNCKSQLIS